MNREIEFRGKRIDNGEWVYGLLIRKVKKHTAIEFCTIGKKIESELFIQGLSIKSEVSILKDFQVIPESVGEYTGLKDKNGEKIFEGDIVKTVDKAYEAGYRLDIVCYSLTKYTSAFDFGSSSRSDLVEIIGNIKNNPELIK